MTRVAVWHHGIFYLYINRVNTEVSQKAKELPQSVRSVHLKGIQTFKVALLLRRKNHWSSAQAMDSRFSSLLVMFCVAMLFNESLSTFNKIGKRQDPTSKREVFEVWVANLLWSERFFPGYSGFPLSSETCLNFNLKWPQLVYHLREVDLTQIKFVCFLMTSMHAYGTHTTRMRPAYNSTWKC